MQRQLYAARGERFPSLPKKIEEVALPEHLKKTKRGDRFLLAEDGTKEKILIFATDENLRLVHSLKDLFADGTFQFCPALFGQLYVIVGCINISTEYREYVPLIFAYLPNKKKKTYVRFLEILKQHVNVSQMAAQNISMDFEMAEIGAWKQVFPSLTIHLCSFHLNKSLHSNLVTEGLKCRYEEKNSKLKEFMQAVYGISFVPTHLLLTAWAAVLMEAIEVKSIFNQSDKEKLDSFLTYVTNTYIHNPNYPHYMWNNYGKYEHRTNNANEGFNSKLAAYDLPKNPNVFRCSEVLLEIELEYFANIRQLQNFLPRKTSKSRLDKEIRLYNKQLQLHNNEINNKSVDLFEYSQFCGRLISKH